MLLNESNIHFISLYNDEDIHFFEFKKKFKKFIRYTQESKPENMIEYIDRNDIVNFIEKLDNIIILDINMIDDNNYIFYFKKNKNNTWSIENVIVE